MGKVAAARFFAAAVVAGLTVAAGCGKDAGEAGSDRGPGGVPAVDAAEFYRDYTQQRGAARLEKYGAGVQVTGAVMKRVDLGPDEGLQLWLAVDGPGHIAVKFQDSGAAARREKIAPGEIITVRCQHNGKPADILFLVDCVLQ